jgi:hypothetical protein
MSDYSIIGATRVAVKSGVRGPTGKSGMRWISWRRGAGRLEGWREELGWQERIWVENLHRCGRGKLRPSAASMYAR